MSRFRHADYLAHPAKYRLFKTATIAAHILTQNGEHDLPQGEIVAIEYRCDAFNPLYRRTEPVYSIKGTGRDLYANALADFCL